VNRQSRGGIKCVPASRSLAVERRTGVASAGPCWWCRSLFGYCGAAVGLPSAGVRNGNATAGNAAI
jgi:hypothetical protein